MFPPLCFTDVTKGQVEEEKSKEELDEVIEKEKKEILELIKRQGNIKIDDICNYTGMDIKTINSNVNELLIDDYIIEMENKTYGFNV